MSVGSLGAGHFNKSPHTCHFAYTHLIMPLLNMLPHRKTYSYLIKLISDSKPCDFSYKV